MQVISLGVWYSCRVIPDEVFTSSTRMLPETQPSANLRMQGLKAQAATVSRPITVSVSSFSSTLECVVQRLTTVAARSTTHALGLDAFGENIALAPGAAAIG